MLNFFKKHPILTAALGFPAALIVLGMGVQTLDAVGVIDMEQIEADNAAAAAEREARRQAEEEARFTPIGRNVPSVIDEQRTNYIPIAYPTDIRRAWDNNRVRAELNFDGINIETQGYVTSIADGVIEISDSNGFSSLSCHYDPSESRDVANLSHRGYIQVRGELEVTDDYLGYTIQLNDCDIAPF